MLVLLFRLLSFLPLRLLHAMGAALGWVVYGLSPSYRRRLRGNLAQAGFGAVLPHAIAEAGKAMFELPFVWCARPERVAACVVEDNYAVFEQALAAGRGVVLLTPHLGCFEVTAQQVALRTRLTVMYRPPKQAALKPLIEGARARANLQLAPATLAGVRILARSLKNGEPIGVLPDQVPQHGEGVWAPFFGQSAYTMTLPAKLAQMGKSPVVLLFAERLPKGQGYRVRFAPFEGSLDGTPAQQAAAVNRAMEQMIAKCPAQYNWSYNRYKQPDGVSAPREGA
ncbi:lysophospholipid acyltransferase family protein [Massilia sp. DWR3-1-1]|uniref:lysophospholipid acyltransferase family protein n=1 Tax=Massilia sp. DWR3-1-1 TaxID=2804559 RepID=UPI003CEE9BBC